MELTKEQLLQIDNYIFVCGIQHYDVRAEIVDHFATILEQKLDENPDLNFKQEISTIHRNFSNRGFSKLLKEKTNSVQKKFYKASFKHLISFFKLPKVIIAVALFFLLQFFMNWFENPKDYFRVLTGLGFVFLLGYFFSLFLDKKNKKTPFLILDMNNSFINFLNLSTIGFNTITTFRSPDSFLNPIHNNLHLAVFVLLVLFFWSGFSVYQQNKKLVKKQYPNVLV